MVEEIKRQAKNLLKEQKVDLVLGYTRAADRINAMPLFVYNEEDVDRLIWDGYCIYNLAMYLKEPEIKNKKAGIIAKGCDAKSIIVLLQENQIKRESIFIIGVECREILDNKYLEYGKELDEMLDVNERCRYCEVKFPPIYDVLIKEDEHRKETVSDKEAVYDFVKKIETKPREDRFKYWKRYISRCIKCYACRQICPMCYCPTCVADQCIPEWFSKTTSLSGNYAWNIVRAYHLVGRCIDCGECERVCPVGIPLRDINKKMEKDVKELFGYEAGKEVEAKPLFGGFSTEDPEDFIK